jgi:hypothetical protein
MLPAGNGSYRRAFAYFFINGNLIADFTILSNSFPDPTIPTSR